MILSLQLEKCKAGIHLHQWRADQHSGNCTVWLNSLRTGVSTLLTETSFGRRVGMWWQRLPGCYIAVAQGETSIRHRLPAVYLEPTSHLHVATSQPKSTVENSGGANSATCRLAVNFLWRELSQSWEKSLESPRAISHKRLPQQHSCAGADKILHHCAISSIPGRSEDANSSEGTLYGNFRSRAQIYRIYQPLFSEASNLETCMRSCEIAEIIDIVQ